MLNARALTPHTGTQVSGFDCSQALPATAVAKILALLDTRGVVVLPGQTLTMAAFIAFARALGPLAPHPHPHLSHAEFPELILNTADNSQPGGMPESGRYWQSDGAHLKTPYRLTLQYAAEMPANDGMPPGAILFANTSAAYEALAPVLREPLRGMRALHASGAARKRRATPFYLDAGMTRIFQGGAEHPVVRAHPVTGRQCLYVDPASTSYIRGMHDRDSRELLAQLHQHLENPVFQYRHRWQAGDVVLWDNCSVQYRIEHDDAPPLRRLLYRAMIKGTPAR